VVDESNTHASRALVAAARASPVIGKLTAAHSSWELEQLISRGDIVVGVYIPHDFEQRLAQQRFPLAQLLIDDSDPIILGAAKGLAQLPVAFTNQIESSQTFEIHALYNPERRSAIFVVPGLCGVILTLTMVLFTSIAIVRERERGNLELLITTPVTSLELMVGKLIPYILIGYVQVSLILGLGVWLFDLPIRGSLLDFCLGVSVFIPSVLTLGLIISTVATTQFQAFQLTFLTFLPQLLLSGFMFPFDGMPKAVQYFAELFPLTHFLRIARGIVIKEAPLMAMTAEIWPLILFFVVGMVFATLRFSKRLD
jgi:ABC-2 type transport system permease protein